MKQVKKKISNKIGSKSFLSKVVKDYDISVTTDFKQILKSMYESGGFEGRHLANGITILQNMINEKNCTKFLCVIMQKHSTSANNNRLKKKRSINPGGCSSKQE